MPQPDIPTQLAQSRTSERKLLSSLLEIPGLLVAVLDANGCVQLFNHACEQLSGLTAEQMAGRELAAVLMPDAAAGTFRDLYSTLCAGQSAGTCVLPLRLPRGGSALIHWRTSLLPGTPSLLLCVGTPITTRERADAPHPLPGLATVEQDLERFRHALTALAAADPILIEQAVLGVIVICTQGVIRSFNGAAETIFGYPAAQTIGQPVGMLMPEPHRSRHGDYLQRYLQGSEPRIIGTGRDVTGVHRDGHALQLRLAVAEVTDHGQRCFVGLVSDITALKQAERQTEDHLQQLSELNRRAAMNALTNDLAHELSQPLTAIRAVASAALAMHQDDSLPSEALQDLLTQINAQAGRAGEIVQQVRRFLRHEPAEPPRAEQLPVLIERVLLLLQHQIQLHDVRVERPREDDLPPCPVHALQIEQVLFNLARNALDAMAEVTGERVLGFTCRHEPEAGLCVVTVTDTGPGIGEQDMARLFEPYFTTRTEGMGQGLPICRSIIEHHGGQLTVRNRAEGGAAFEFTLPCGPVDEACDGC